MTEVWLEKARELAPIVAQYRDESERERRLPAPVFDAMRERGLWSLLVPKTLGGHQVPMLVMAEVLEEVSSVPGRHRLHRRQLRTHRQGDPG